MFKISRDTALRVGKKLYFTGDPCKNNHLAERYTKTGVCVACHRGRSAANAKKTAAKFASNPFNVQYVSLAYRTDASRQTLEELAAYLLEQDRPQPADPVAALNSIFPPEVLGVMGVPTLPGAVQAPHAAAILTPIPKPPQP